MIDAPAALLLLVLTSAGHPEAAGAAGLQRVPSTARIQSPSRLVSSSVSRPAARAASLGGQTIAPRDPDGLAHEGTSVDQETDAMIAEGASKILDGLKGPIEYPLGDRMLPDRMHDTETAADMYPAADLDFTTEPKSVPRPYEIETPRERDARDAQQQLDELYRDQPETDIASVVPDHSSPSVRFAPHLA